MRRWALCAIAAAALVACGGDGSDDDDGGSRTAATSTGASNAARGEYVRRVDGLCRETRPELAQITADLTRTRDAARAGRAELPETFDRFSTLLRRAGDITDRLEARLREIEAPARERKFHDSLVETVRRGSVNLRRQVRAADREDANELRALSVDGSLISSNQRGLITGHGGFRYCNQR